MHPERLDARLSMKIWVDADACPGVIRDILLRAAERTEVKVTFVSNRQLRLPRSKFVDSMTVAAGFDVADREIVERLEAGDLVVTGDIPLAAEAIDRACLALGFRGELHTRDNIRSRLAMRDFMETLRASGIQSGGPAALGPTDRKTFADQLDRLLASRSRRD
jgi:uncharacterized protein